MSARSGIRIPPLRALAPGGARLLGIVATLLVASPNAADAKPAAQWPTFGGNPQRTGRSNASGPRHGRVAWKVALGAPVRSPPAVGARGIVYVGSDAGELHAVDPTGRRLDAIKLGGRIWAAPLWVKGRIFVGSDNQRFYGIGWKGERLQTAWSVKTGDFIYSSALAVGADVVFGSWDGRVYRRRRSDGKLRWKYRGRGDFESSPALSNRGKTIYIGSRDRKLHAVSKAGRRRWRAGARDSVNSTPMVGPDGTVYFGSDDGRLRAYTARGRRRWTFRAEADILSSPALSPDGRTLYVGSHDGHLYAIDARKGSQRWKLACDVVWSSPAVDKEGVIYFGAWDGKIYAVGPEGTARWTVTTGGPIWSSPALAEGRLYIGSNDGHLYAIE